MNGHCLRPWIGKNVRSVPGSRPGSPSLLIRPSCVSRFRRFLLGGEAGLPAALWDGDNTSFVGLVKLQSESWGAR